MTAKTTNAKADSDGLTVQIKGKTFCPANKFQKMVSGKYKLRILWALKGGWKRYSGIKRGLLTGSIGTAEIAQRVLTRRVEDLSRDGNGRTKGPSSLSPQSGVQTDPQGSDLPSDNRRHTQVGHAALDLRRRASDLLARRETLVVIRE